MRHWGKLDFRLVTGTCLESRGVAPRIYYPWKKCPTYTKSFTTLHKSVDKFIRRESDYLLQMIRLGTEVGIQGASEIRQFIELIIFTYRKKAGARFVFSMSREIGWGVWFVRNLNSWVRSARNFLSYLAEVLNLYEVACIFLLFWIQFHVNGF